jgi:hypothetical protein
MSYYPSVSARFTPRGGGGGGGGGGWWGGRGEEMRYKE